MPARAAATPICSRSASARSAWKSALQERFPEARILRVDRDSTRNKGTWNAMRKQIQDEAVDILVGTQMLAKGHDFPNLTLVGVLNPDSALYSSDFRASEKLFAQLAQVAGRAGRARQAGRGAGADRLSRPPAVPRAARARLRCLGRDPAGRARAGRIPALRLSGVAACRRQARRRSVCLHATGAQTRRQGWRLPVEIYGVVPAAMPRRANHLLAQLLVQCDSRKPLQQFLHAWRPLLESLPAQKLRWSLDIDPLEL